MENIDARELDNKKVLEAYRRLSDLERSRVDALAALVESRIKDRRNGHPVMFGRLNALELLAKLGLFLVVRGPTCPTLPSPNGRAQFGEVAPAPTPIPDPSPRGGKGAEGRKLKFVANMVDPNEKVARLYVHRSPGETQEEAWERQVEWLARKVIGEPMATADLSVEILKGFNIVGVYEIEP